MDILEGKQVYLSIITELELYGFKKLKVEARSKIEALLSYCTLIDINAGIKAQTIMIRQRYSLKLPDSIVAGTALYFDIPLMSADKEFKKVDILNLLSYQR